MSPRYLTKSRFKLANECPTKLFYTAKEDVYADQALEDPLLAALAEGGFQVGEFATALFPGGECVGALEYEEALAHTAELLARDEVVIFEPAFLWEGMFVRVDILVKSGEQIQLIEVKSKSCKGADEAQFLGGRGKILSAWRPYLDDVAFQHYVVSQAQPSWSVTAFLMLVDKEVSCPTDGLHQKFLLEKGPDGRMSCRQTAKLDDSETGSGLLAQVPIVELLERLQTEALYGPDSNWLLADWSAHLRDKYAADERIRAAPGTHCRECSFQASETERAAGLRSGFRECWAQVFNFTDEDFAQPSVLEVWNSQSKNAWLAVGRARINQLRKVDFDYHPTHPGAMEPKERQWIQVDKVQRGDESAELRPALAEEMRTWSYPLHCIDFETMMPAIPMHAGCHPYQVLAFQFSHHVLHADGRVEHAGEYLEERVGEFPNIDFVRALRGELNGDQGTIFRYSPHENTVLCSIREQILRDRAQIADHAELVAFIESITQPRGKEAGWQPGPRNMVDLLELTKKYYYDPLMGGSNSIKQVLPAVLATSPALHARYPEYYDEHGQPGDPYAQLPTLFEDLSEHDREQILRGAIYLEESGAIADGGAAMTAFARMQYMEMGAAERAALCTALRQYCKLDTLAMVMIIQAWQGWIEERGW